jgi:hypothetical protein
MVCSKCEKKLTRGIHQEMWKEGSRHTIEGGGRKLNENKALSSKKRWTPYGAGGGGGKCKICKQSLHQEGIYCHKCAFAKGECSMCGVKVMDTTYYAGHSEPFDRAKGKRGHGEDVAAAAAKDAGGSLGARGDGGDDDDDDGPEFLNDGPPPPGTEEATAAEAAMAAATAIEAAKAEASAAIESNRISGTTTLAQSVAEHATAATGQSVTGWQYDSGSGLYYDTQAQMYFDAKTQKYFCCKTQKWLESDVPTAAQLASGDTKVGSFSRGTRVPDKWGL